MSVRSLSCSLHGFGSGFVVQSMLALWLFQNFQLSTAVTGTVFFWAGLFSALSYLVAVRIADRFGLVNTMVFTHLPANLLLILIPFMPSLSWAVALLLARSLLSQMDVPTRSSYVMAIVPPEERAAAASITTVPGSLASAAGLFLAGYLLSIFFWVAAGYSGRPENRLQRLVASHVSNRAAAGGGPLST